MLDVRGKRESAEILFGLAITDNFYFLDVENRYFYPNVGLRDLLQTGQCKLLSS